MKRPIILKLLKKVVTGSRPSPNTMTISHAMLHEHVRQLKVRVYSPPVGYLRISCLVRLEAIEFAKTL